MTTKEDIKAQISWGIEQGIEQGIEKGIEQGMSTLIKTMRGKGMSVEDIAKCTDLSEDEIVKMSK